MPLWLHIFGIIISGGLSALFSGLALGILMLDTLQLNLLILVAEKNNKELQNAKNARRILPLRNNTNEILVTFITANVMANSAFSLLVGELSGSFNSFIISTVFITVFGEIIPQSICSRHGLAVGAFCIPLIYFLRFFLYIFVKPISYLLDKLVGKDVLNTYDRKQLKALVDMHKNRTDILHEDEAKILVSALEFSQYKVIHIMTDIDYVFGVDYDSVINYSTLKKILKSGFSRIPVLNRNKPDCIVGLFHIKDLMNIWIGINKILLNENYNKQFKKETKIVITKGYSTEKLERNKETDKEEEEEQQQQRQQQQKETEVENDVENDFENDVENDVEKRMRETTLTMQNPSPYKKENNELSFIKKEKVYNLKKSHGKDTYANKHIRYSNNFYKNDKSKNVKINEKINNEKIINELKEKKTDNKDNVKEKQNKRNDIIINKNSINDEGKILKKCVITTSNKQKMENKKEQKNEQEQNKEEKIKKNEDVEYSTRKQMSWMTSEIFHRIRREKNINEIYKDLKQYATISQNNDIEIPLKHILKHIGRYIYGVDYDENIWSLLNFFKTVNNHIVVVRKVIYGENEDPKYAHIGIITLEDVIEILLQEEISDEFDFKMVKKETDLPNNFIWKQSTDSLNLSDEENDTPEVTGIKFDVDDEQEQKDKSNRWKTKDNFANAKGENNVTDVANERTTKIVIEHTEECDEYNKHLKTVGKQIEAEYYLTHNKNSIASFLKENIYFKYIDTDLINAYIKNKKTEKINKNECLLAGNSFLNYAIILIKGTVRNVKPNSPIIQGQCFIALEALGPFNIIELFNNIIENRIDVLKHFEEKKKKKIFIKKCFTKNQNWKDKIMDFKKKKKQRRTKHILSGNISSSSAKVGKCNTFVQKGVNILFRKWYTQHVYYNRTTYIAESPCEFLRIPKRDYMDMILRCYENDKVDAVI